MKIFAAQNNYEDAYHFAELYYSYNDSLVNEAKAKAVSEIEFNYQSRAQENEIETLRIARTLDKEKLRRKNITLSAIFILSILFGAVLIILVIFQRRMQLFNTELRSKNQIITKQNISLDNLNNTKDKILSIITHDLRGTIGNQLTALSILSNEEFRDEQERQLVFSRITNSARLSIELLENLLLWIKVQENNLSFNPVRGDVQRVVLDTIEQFEDSLNSKGIKLANRLDNIPFVEFDDFMLRSILKNLLTNAIKFSNSGGSIVVEGMKEKEMLVLRILDDGIGMKENELQGFVEGRNIKLRRGTANEKGSGIGLYLVKTFLDFHKGELVIKSEPGKGTSVTIFLPL